MRDRYLRYRFILNHSIIIPFLKSILLINVRSDYVGVVLAYGSEWSSALWYPIDLVGLQG